MRKHIAPSRIESLESRIAPASLVTVTFAKGALALTGDAGAHDFTITSLDATTTQLKAAAGTLFHLDGVADSDTFLLTGALKSLTATFNNGVDHLALVGLNIGGDVNITGGAGANTIDFNTVSITGGLKITGGADADTVNLGGGNLTVKKALTLELGDGANEFNNMSFLTVGKDLVYTGGSGADSFTVGQGNINIAGNFTVTTGAGDATFGLGSNSVPIVFGVGKKFTVDSTGSLAGDDVEVTFGGYSTKIGGDIQVMDGAGDLMFGTQSIATTGFHGKVFVGAGAGEAKVQLALYQFFAKSITVDASASSASSLALGGFGTSFATNVNYTGGSGVDEFLIQTYSLAGGSSLGASFTANLGDGNNTVNVSSAAGFFKTAKIITGAGDDHLAVVALGAKATSLDIQTGGGTDDTTIAFLNSTISGKLSVSNAANAVKETVHLGFLNSVVGSMDIGLSGDGNRVEFGSSFINSTTNGLTVKKALHITGGAGADTVAFLNAANLKATGGISLELGDGTNAVTGPLLNVAVKSFSVTGGSGADSVTLPASGSLGAVTLTLGAGANTAAITGGAAPLALGSLVYGSTSAVADADGLALARIIVAGKVDAKFGAGASTLSVDDSIIGGTFNAETGAGADMVKIDTTDSYTGTVLAKAVTLKLGDDSDTLVLGGNGTSELVTTKATFSADGGTGTNTLTNAMTNVFAKLPVTTGF